MCPMFTTNFSGQASNNRRRTVAPDGGTITASVRLLFAGLEPFREKDLLGFDFRELQGFSEMSRRSVRVMQTRLEFTEHGIKEVIRLKRCQVLAGTHGF